jgi:hypothetical protein
LDGRFPVGAGGALAKGVGGFSDENSHSHTMDHTHGMSHTHPMPHKHTFAGETDEMFGEWDISPAVVDGTTNNNYNNRETSHTGNVAGASHRHTFKGTTDDPDPAKTGDADPFTTGAPNVQTTGSSSAVPPYFSLVFCQKD